MAESNNGRSEQSKGEVRYLVAVKYEGDTEIFSFSSAQDRQGFLADLERRWPGTEWATSEASGE
jgi:hypothetical protein